MIATAAYIYLPDHIRAIYSHLYYYWVGERPFISTLPSIQSFSFFGDAPPPAQVGVVYDTAKNAAAAATATMEL